MTYAVLVLAVLPAAPDPDVRLKTEIDALVQALGHRDYKLREQAGRQLLEIGAPAAHAIKTGQASPDSEIGDRCKKLYPQIWALALDKRLAKFVTATGAKDSEDLPFAKTWLEFVGDSAAGRELYANMVRAHADRLREAEGRPDRVPAILAEFAKGVYTKNVPASVPRPGSVIGVPDVALFLFLGAVADVRGTNSPGMIAYSTQFLNSEWLAKALGGDAPSKPARALFAKWLEKERYSIVMRRGMDLAAMHKVTECVPAVLKIAGDTNTPPHIRATALLGFSRLGIKDNLKDLEPFLRDTGMVSTVAVAGGLRTTIQTRDVALGAALLIAGQSPKEFGFEREAPTAATLMSYTYYGFSDDDKRDAAHARWKAWATANLKK